MELETRQRRKVAIVLAGAAFIVAIGAWMFADLYHEAKYSGYDAVCWTNLKSIDRAAHLYSADNEGLFPLAPTWREATMPYIKEDYELRCPWSKAPHTYAMNKQVAGKKFDQLEEKPNLILFFETETSDLNAAGGSEMLMSAHKRPVIALPNEEMARYTSDKFSWTP